jgi:hypothetical protein
MKTRLASPSVPLAAVSALALALALSLALALGAAGTATAAAGLTKGAVRKIAVKAVTKAAPSLSVNHARTADSATRATTADTATKATTATTATTSTTATTATNATMLGGLPPSAYSFETYRFLLPTPGTMSASKDWNLDNLPQGTYLFSYDVVAQPSGTKDVNCWVDPKDGTGLALGDANGSTYGTTSVAAGSGVLTEGEFQTPQLHCSGEGETFRVWNNNTGFPSVITLTQVSGVVAGTTNNQ